MRPIAHSLILSADKQLPKKPVGIQSSIGTFGNGTGNSISFGGFTFQHTIWIPTGVRKVRVKLESNALNSSSYKGVSVAVQTTDGSNLVNPRKGLTVLPMKRCNFGKSDNPIYTDALTVDYANGAWTNWTNVEYLGNSPSYLIIRVFFPSTCAPTSMGGGNLASDRVTKLVSIGSNGFWGFKANSFNPLLDSNATFTAGGSIIPLLIEFQTDTIIPSIVMFGDSTRYGYLIPGNVSYLERACTTITAGGKPVSFDNQAVTAQTSLKYNDRLFQRIADGCKPSIIVYQVETSNDGFGPIPMAAQINRANAAIALADSIGAKIILDGPVPASLTTPTQATVTHLQGILDYLTARQAEGRTVCLYPGLHDPSQLGQWVAIYAQDAAHPNEAGIVNVMEPNMRSTILGLI